jgi:hypothetical protein
MLVTEFDFRLPLGFIDAEGNLHRDGRMRRATARDEIEPMRDPRVVQNAAYLPVIVLARTVLRLGALSTVTPKTIEELSVADFDYLQRFYNQINSYEPEEITCPHCHGSFRPETSAPGGS